MKRIDLRFSIARWHLFTASLALIMLCFCKCTPAFADPGDMQKGLAALNAGKYSLALGSFELAVKAEPANVQARYCLAVCYHYLGRTNEANREYGWVCTNSRDADLLRRAKKGLSACPVMAPATTPGPDVILESSSTNSPKLVRAPNMVATSLARPSGFQRMTASTSATPMSSGRPKIVDCYTTWCHWCRVFEPQFEEAQKKYGEKIEFERINAELPENKEFCQKNGVHSFPSILLFDGSGALVNTVKGCPKSFGIFEKSILTAFPFVR